MDVLECLNFKLLYIKLSAFYYNAGFTINDIPLFYSVDSLFFILSSKFSRAFIRQKTKEKKEKLILSVKSFEPISRKLRPKDLFLIKIRCLDSHFRTCLDTFFQLPDDPDQSDQSRYEDKQESSHIIFRFEEICLQI